MQKSFYVNIQHSGKTYWHLSVILNVFLMLLSMFVVFLSAFLVLLWALLVFRVSLGVFILFLGVIVVFLSNSCVTECISNVPMCSLG